MSTYISNRRQRNWIAIVQLSVFMSLNVTIYVHTREVANSENSFAFHSHNGASGNDCLICQFSSVQYVSAQPQLLPTFSRVLFEYIRVSEQTSLTRANLFCYYLRAPPYTYLS